MGQSFDDHTSLLAKLQVNFCEAAVYAIRFIFSEANSQGLLLSDASNAF